MASSVSSQPPLPPPDEEPAAKEPPSKKDQLQPGVTLVDKGPIHEAFAQPGAETRGKDMTAPKAPPEPINEVPPDIKPEGTNVKWIPGYWQWDANKNDFIWVSGFYRNVPPNREWQAGKWIEKDGKNIYVPGYWRPTKTVPSTPLVDVPEPPKSIENGPSTPSDNPDAMWVPGGWEYRNSQFVWRAGYWAAPYLQMMWQPSQYVYNGSEYNYVPGYWDYPLEQRGLLTAPVYIDPQFAINPNWSYTPQYGIGIGDTNGWGNGGLFGSMYLGPNYNNYYYGNGNGGGGYIDPYGLGGFGFGSGYGDPLFGYGGYYPWSFVGAGFYNPLWQHYNWLNRGDRGWGANARAGRNGGFGRTGVGGVASARATATPRSVGSVASTAGNAARVAASVTAANRSAQVVRPANQVLASQAIRANASASNSIRGTLSGSNLGNTSLGQGNAYGVQRASGVSNFSAPSYRGMASEPILRGANSFGANYSGPGYHSSSSYGSFHSSGGIRSGGGGGGGRGGHR
jgi:hypothetical protein